MGLNGPRVREHPVPTDPTTLAQLTSSRRRGWWGQGCPHAIALGRAAQANGAARAGGAERRLAYEHPRPVIGAARKPR